MTGHGEPLVDILQGLGEDRFEQFVRDFSDCLFFRPAVHLLGAAVPKANRAVPIQGEDRVVREFQQLRLLADGIGGIDGLGGPLAELVAPDPPRRGASPPRGPG